MKNRHFSQIKKIRKTDTQTDIATILWVKSTREVAFPLGSKGLQSLKVSNIWALPMMALPCNWYKLNLLTSASMCHMALCFLCWKLHSNFSFLLKKMRSSKPSSHGFFYKIRFWQISVHFMMCFFRKKMDWSFSP